MLKRKKYYKHSYKYRLYNVIPLFLITFSTIIQKDLLNVKTSFFQRNFLQPIEDNEIVHKLGLQCLKNSNSPYGYKEIPYNSNYTEREAHFNYIKKATEEYRRVKGHCYSNYCGPWIEEVWVDTFLDEPLSTFGPYIPLFVQWLDIFKKYNHDSYQYQDTVSGVFRLLRKDFIYITVIQSLYGIEGTIELWDKVPNNIIILAPASRGHVPIPHLKGIFKVYDMKPVKYVASFLGMVTYNIRPYVLSMMKNRYKDRFFSDNLDEKWLDIHAESKVVLSPRGHARGCFRTFEILQQGFIPVVIFQNNHIWMPYWNSSLPWEDMAIVGTAENMYEIFDQIDRINEERRRIMRETIIHYINSHFTYDGVMEQIALFMKGGGDLRCDKYYSEIDD